MNSTHGHRAAAEPTPFADVNAALAYFCTGSREVLDNRLCGMYLVGSLALGDFDPETSDIDFLVVTTGEIDDTHVARLGEMHARFAQSDSPWVGKIEAVYVPITALRQLGPDVMQVPQVEKGTELVKAPLESGWVFQCISLRERGVVIAGPDPHTLVAPADPRDLHAAAAQIAGLWLTQADTDPTWLPWLREREAHAFVVLTLCRLLYSLTTGSVASKPRAAAWARAHLDARWAALIDDTLANRREPGGIAPSEEAETLAFIRFTFARAERGPVLR